MEKAECLNDYFVSISTVDDSNVQLPHLVFKYTLIEFVENHKHLGLTLSNTGK